MAIFIQNLADQGQFYTMRGEWFHRNNDYTRFSIPHFVHPDELRDILPYLPTTEVADEMIDKMHPLNASAPRDAGARLLKKMSLFHQTADDAFRKHADRLTRVYEIVAPLEADAGKITMTLGQIAMAVLQKTNPAELTPAMMWAVHRAVTQSQNISYDTLNYRQNAVYEIYPQQNLREIAQVRDWVRDFQEGIIEDVTETYDSDATNKDSKKSRNPIAMFVENARAAVKRSRQTRALAPSGCLGPSSVRLTAPEMSMSTYKCSDYQMLSDQEKTIVRYMDAWAVSRHLNPYTHLKASGPMILRAVGMYDGYELDEVTGFTFLQELGIISPWENLLVHRTPNLRLPDHDRGVEESTRLRKEAYNESKGFAVLKDSMQGLRKDWGDLPVFCIDSAQTVERDDGVSVQDVEDSETEYWVHVHVANPSAFIDPNSATGKYAARLSESVYFPEHKYPMLYPPLTAERLSLASGRPCLTFSARISAEGDILEKKIVPGVVHNVHNLAPSAVARELGIDEGEYSESEKLLTVGGEFSATPNLQADVSDRPSKKSQSGMLRKLLEVGEAIGRRRARNGAPEFHSSDQLGAAYPRVFLGTHDRPYRIRDDAFSTYEGDPFISIEKPSAAHGLVTQMVSNLMILAGEVGASWCMERNMPIPYRGLLRDPEPSCSPEVYKTEVIDASIGKFGTVNPHDLMRYMRLLGRTIGSSTPLEHIALGLPGYCKTTSPLRRHVDMYTHWQIEAAIRHEAATGTSLIGSTDESYLAFSREAVQQYASEAVRRERKLHAAKMAATRHWVIQAFFRAFYFKEAPLPETFKVTALPRHTEMQPGWLEGWNTKVLLTKNKATEDEDGIEPGDVWEARIKEINTYYVNIHMEPIALLERKKPE